MKIKLLAIAAATLAVGAITAQAQTPVYSQNVVGYATLTSSANQYVLWCNPLSTGNDVITNVLHGLPGNTSLYYWNGNGWNTYNYSAATKHWTDTGANVVDNTNLPPGQGFFLFNPTKAFTNSFAGQIVANTGGGKCTNSIPLGYSPLGALVPYSDVPTNAATFNLTVGGTSTMQIWNVASQQYDPAYSYSAAQKSWQVAGNNTNPIIQVGQGFFLSPKAATNWIQTLQ